jgi:hypothetical protein
MADEETGQSPEDMGLAVAVGPIYIHASSAFNTVLDEKTWTPHRGEGFSAHIGQVGNWVFIVVNGETLWNFMGRRKGKPENTE